MSNSRVGIVRTGRGTRAQANLLRLGLGLLGGHDSLLDKVYFVLDEHHRDATDLGLDLGAA